MTESGLMLSTTALETASNVATGIAASVVNIGPQLLFLGLGVFGAIYVIGKIPSWFKKFIN
jgi:hypothetical protein